MTDGRATWQPRSLGFRTDLALRRLAGAAVEERPGAVLVRTPRNPGFYWGNFLLAHKPPGRGDASRLLELFAQEFPTATHVAIGVDGTDGDRGDDTAFREAGLEPDVGIVLTTVRLLPPFRVDPAAELRPLRTDDDWRQSAQLQIEVDEQDDEAHREFVVRRAAESRALVDGGHGVYVGAFVDGVMRAGLGLFAVGDGLGRYQTVETHPQFRRRGLAAGLLALAAEIGAARHGIGRLVIVADPDYVAIDLYRRAGFADAEHQVQWQRSPG